jgi:hypothetical protein
MALSALHRLKPQKYVPAHALQVPFAALDFNGTSTTRSTSAGPWMLSTASWLRTEIRRPGHLPIEALKATRSRCSRPTGTAAA